MTYKIVNGSYVTDENNKLVMIEYIEQLLQNAVLMIGAQRGKFYPDKNFGSQITSCVNEASALGYARQSLADLDGVFVKSAKINDGKITFSLIINDEERSVVISND